MSRTHARAHAGRRRLVLLALIGVFGLLATRAAYLQAWNTEYLQTEGTARHLRLVKDNSHRGMILDRNGVPLAISTPVDSVWAHPETLLAERGRIRALATVLDIAPAQLMSIARKNKAREFVYLKRHIAPDQARRIDALGLKSVGLTREYRRYYPTGATTAHVLGFTNIDDQGQEGLELVYDARLRAIPGTKRVIKDLYGNAVEMVESVTPPVPGRDLIVSLDRRVQYLAYRELKAAIEAHGARAGTAVMLDVRTGEVLAMVSQPDFNPHNRAELHNPVFRNRAVTDVFEPGSTLKPFTIAAGLETRRFRPMTLIDTNPGYVQLGGRTIRDLHNYGLITVERVIEKSSNVGATRIALAVDKDDLWDMLKRAGFGTSTGSRLPGESIGVLRSPSTWVPVEQASLSYGYGISVTALQLARAYAMLANGGYSVPITLVRRAAPVVREPVLDAAIARQISHMLELAVGDEGTGGRARVPDYRVAGKTGTVRKLTPEGYTEEQYVSWFAGFAPATDPRLAMVVVVDSPTRGGYFGGEVAAPVFARVMAGALRLLDIPPDAPRALPTRFVAVTPSGGA